MATFIYSRFLVLTAAVLVLQVVRFAAANNLYEFGVAYGDIELVSSDEKVVLSTPFVFYGTSYTSLYVSYY